MSYLDSVKLREKCSIIVDRVHTVELDVPQELQSSHDWKVGDVVYYQQHADNNLIFCQPEFFSVLLSLGLDLSDKILITHHSDVNILSWQDGVAKLSLGPQIVWEQAGLNATQWFARNTCCAEVKAIPCGLYPERYGKNDMFDRLLNTQLPKDYLVYVNFNPNSNVDRIECLKYVKAHNHYNNAITQEFIRDAEYKFLEDVRKSYFVASPNGFGVDCHRHWEALQLGAIPIVTDSELIRQLSKYYPFVILPTWSDYNPEEITVDLYNDLWSDFDQQYLDLNYLLNKLIN